MWSKTALACLALASSVAGNQGCKCFPGDKCWPTPKEWAAFNATVGGRLVATVPLGAPCHDNTFTPYNKDSCNNVKLLWPLPETHYKTSSSPMASWFANNSCNPFTEESALCDGRIYVQYAVRATSADDYAETLKFATKRNIRLVVRNTGHDYHGKSTGAGGLALWTHYLKDIQVINEYRSSYYSGPALKIGAGVQAFEAYEAADKANLAVTGGDCFTVGLAGGFSQGGGLGPMATMVGLAADQILEWEVVTADGSHLIASPNKNQDLYWAITGGGGGTYAAVLSATLRAYPTFPVSGATMTVSSKGVDPAAWDSFLKAFHKSLPSWTDKKVWASYAFVGDYFFLNPLFGPHLSTADVQKLLAPALQALNQSKISYDLSVKSFDRFKPAYYGLVPENNVTIANLGGRLIQRDIFFDDAKVGSLQATIKSIVAGGGIVSGIVSDQSAFPKNVKNAVNPAFRSSLVDVVFGLPYDEVNYDANIPLQTKITNVWMKQLEDLTPGGGAYLNEGDINQPNFQQAFYGTNYPKLLAIKDKYDPGSVFYGLNAVGSERWDYRMHTDGRLCKKQPCKK